MTTGTKFIIHAKNLSKSELHKDSVADSRWNDDDFETLVFALLEHRITSILQEWFFFCVDPVPHQIAPMPMSGSFVMYYSSLYMSWSIGVCIYT